MVYLDYAATCPVVKYPQQLYRNVLGEGYFLNPNANYAYKEKRLLAEAENRVKKAVVAKGGKVIFGGTSSQLIENLEVALDSMIHGNIGSAYEHNSVDRFLMHNNLKTLDDLERELSTLKKWGKNIVFWQGVNNVTGQIFDIEKIGKLCHKYKAFYICDMTAMIGHAPIPANIDDWCDCAVWSGHKLGTELGIGAMWMSKRFSENLDILFNIFKLHGTPNLAGALAMTQAVEDACDKQSLYERIWHYADLANCLSDELVRNNIEFNVVSEYPDNDEQPFAYAINAIRLPGFNADALQQYLASKQIYVSIGGSACAEKHDYRILETGYNLTKQEASEIIRVSFGENSTVEDIETLVKNIREFKKIYLDN